MSLVLTRHTLSSDVEFHVDKTLENENYGRWQWNWLFFAYLMMLAKIDLSCSTKLESTPTRESQRRQATVFSAKLRYWWWYNEITFWMASHLEIKNLDELLLMQIRARRGSVQPNVLVMLCFHVCLVRAWLRSQSPDFSLPDALGELRHGPRTYIEWPPRLSEPSSFCDRSVVPIAYSNHHDMWGYISLSPCQVASWYCVGLIPRVAGVPAQTWDAAASAFDLMNVWETRGENGEVPEGGLGPHDQTLEHIGMLLAFKQVIFVFGDLRLIEWLLWIVFEFGSRSNLRDSTQSLGWIESVSPLPGSQKIFITLLCCTK